MEGAGGNIAPHASHSPHAPVTLKVSETINEERGLVSQSHQPTWLWLPRWLVRNGTFRSLWRVLLDRTGPGDGSAL